MKDMRVMKEETHDCLRRDLKEFCQIQHMEKVVLQTRIMHSITWISYLNRLVLSTSNTRMLLVDLQRLRQIGCFVTTSETVIFKILGDKDNPKFTDIRHLVKEPSPFTGLVSNSLAKM